MKTFSLAPFVIALVAHGCTAPDRAAAPAGSATAPLALDAPSECAGHECGEGNAPDLAEGPVKVTLEGLPTFGPDTALVTVVAFVDYECPYSAKMHSALAELRKTYGDDLRVAIATNPLPFHDRAAPAARAFLAAAVQGRGEAIEGQLYGAQHDDAAIRDGARAAGVDLAAFDASLSSAKTDAMFERARALTKSLGVTGTPTVFVDGRRIVGAQLDLLRSTVEARMKQANADVEHGARRADLYARAMATAEVAVVQPPPEPALAVPVDVPLDGAPIRGPKDAPITIVVFADYECPFCVRLDKTLHELEAQYPGKIRFAMRQKPLPRHASSRLAAKAAIAADAQGKFWALHDVLVQHRDALDRASLVRYAGEVGLDGARFVRDLDAPATEEKLVADEARAAALHVNGTPTAFVSGRRLDGAQPIETFRRAIAATLR